MRSVEKQHQQIAVRTTLNSLHAFVFFSYLLTYLVLIDAPRTVTHSTSNCSRTILYLSLLISFTLKS